VDGDEVRDQLLVGLPDVPPLPLLWSEHCVVIKWIIHHGETQVLQVDPDLVHPASEGAAQHHAGHPVVAQPLELCAALLAVCGHLAHPYLVADHLHWLATLCLALRELSLHPADILLQHLPVPDLLLHLPGLPGVPPEHQQPGGQAVQPVDGAQVLQVVFLRQYEDHCVMAVSSTWVHLITQIMSDMSHSDNHTALTLHHPASACVV